MVKERNDNISAIFQLIQGLGAFSDPLKGIFPQLWHWMEKSLVEDSRLEGLVMSLLFVGILDMGFESELFDESNACKTAAPPVILNAFKRISI